MMDDDDRINLESSYEGTNAGSDANVNYSSPQDREAAREGTSRRQASTDSKLRRQNMVLRLALLQASLLGLEQEVEKHDRFAHHERPPQHQERTQENSSHSPPHSE